jgi:lysyl-tRNA synthetase class 2
MMLARIRAYFHRHEVLEVDTPVLSTAGVTDPAIRSFSTTYRGPGPCNGRRFYLHSSPEFPMKRLLAAGCGSIYQICKVFRDGESGHCHNPEFTLLEWYRTGYDQNALMLEVEILMSEILDGLVPAYATRHRTYRELFLEAAAVDPFTASCAELRQLLHARGIGDPLGLAPDDRDGWLDVVMTHIVVPRLGEGVVFIRDYPASQAALARLRPGHPPVAARFEVYLNGMELANGYHELADVAEQQRRFVRDNERRRQQGAAPVTPDRRLLAALAAGLPDCAGVALGIDRLLMVVRQTVSIDEVMAFPIAHA